MKWTYNRVILAATGALSGLIILGGLFGPPASVPHYDGPGTTWGAEEQAVTPIHTRMVLAGLHGDRSRFEDAKLDLTRRCRPLVSWARSANPISDDVRADMGAVRAACADAGVSVPLPY